jgi:hypothetical protein
MRSSVSRDIPANSVDSCANFARLRCSGVKLPFALSLNEKASEYRFLLYLFSKMMRS